MLYAPRGPASSQVKHVVAELCVALYIDVAPSVLSLVAVLLREVMRMMRKIVESQD